VYKIKIDPERKRGKISTAIYGHFIEHLRRCIYGGIVDYDSPLSDAGGFRKDVIEAVRKIGCPVLRWPGGNFASNYHWEDGIGPPEERPVKLDLAWLGEETNRFGTDEFIEYCRMIGAEPYICLNLGTGDLEEALHWLEYCNGTGSSCYAKLREKNGHPNAYGVKYWGVGNEIFGDWQVGHTNAAGYARRLVQDAKFLKKVDPSVKIIAVGADDPGWDLEVLDTAGDYIDYISNHQYLGSEDYYDTVAAARWVEKRLEILCKTIDIYKNRSEANRDVKIALDEWNIWYRAGAASNWEENYSLKDGLFAAGVFLALFRLCNKVTMANLAQLTNVLGAIHVEKQGLFVTPIYHVFDLFVNHSGETVVDTLVRGDSYSIAGKGHFGKVSYSLEDAPYMDACATFNEEENKMYLACINYHRDEPLECEIETHGFTVKNSGSVWVLNGPDPWSCNDFDNPERVTVYRKKMKDAHELDHYQFPAHSLTIFELRSG
jgi:alpha-N-arabinofuranosidase